MIGGLETVVNYNSGQTSMFRFAGLQAPGWNGGVSGSLYSGFVWGLDDANSNYKGGFTALSGGGTVGGFLESSSGGTEGGLRGVFPDWKVFAAGVSVGGSLTSYSGGLQMTNYSAPMPRGRFVGFTDLDYLLYTARQLCQ